MADDQFPSVWPHGSEPVFWRWWYRALLALLLAALIATRVLAHLYGGGLWRDEAHTVSIATHPGFWQNCLKDSFPILWTLSLRAWVFVFGSGDEAVRSLGLLTSLAIIPAMFWMARQFGVTVPYWLLLFLGLDPTLIIFGGEVRGYGLGVLTFIVLVGMAWRTLQTRSPWRWAAMCVASLLAVQASFTNCFLLLATICACCVVALRRRQYLAIVQFVSVGVLAAASMLPYAILEFPRVAEWAVTFRKSYSLGALAEICFDAFAGGGSLRMLAWLAVGAIGFFEIGRQVIFRNSADENAAGQAVSETEIEQGLFLATLVVIGTAGFWFYVKWLGVMTQVWYYLPWLTLLAIATELGSSLWTRRTAGRRQLVLLAAPVCLLILINVVPAVEYRLTDIDLVAQRIASEAGPNDLVVICPWYMGISFERYYHGSAQWTNFPDVHHFLHAGYLEVKQKVMSKGTPAGVASDLDRMRKVLQSGGRIFWVGHFRALPPTQAPLALEPAPDPRFGWDEGVYENSCLEFAGQEIRTWADSVQRIDIKLPETVNPFEAPPILIFQRRR